MVPPSTTRRTLLAGTSGILAALSGCTSATEIRENAQLAKEHSEEQLSSEEEKVIFHPDDPGRDHYPPSAQSADEALLDTKYLEDGVARRLEAAHVRTDLWAHATLSSVPRMHSAKMASESSVARDVPAGTPAEREYAQTVLSFEVLYRFVSATDVSLVNSSGGRIAPSFDELASTIYRHFASLPEMEAVLTNDAVQAAGTGIYFTISEETDGAVNATIFTTIDLVAGMQVEDQTEE